MPKLVPIAPAKMIRILVRLGFEEVRVKGSHHFFVNSVSNKSTTVPVHSNEVLGIGILKMILRDIELPLDEYEKLRLKK